MGLESRNENQTRRIEDFISADLGGGELRCGALTCFRACGPVKWNNAGTTPDTGCTVKDGTTFGAVEIVPTVVAVWWQ
jgi:hypothetical protein